MMSALRTWLQLFRAPNLFTVPGDPLAGYLLACFGDVQNGLFTPIAASLCFYAAGLLLNDLADLAEDRAERPNRPLPSGAARPRTVAVVMVALFIGGLVLCAQAGVWTLGTGVAIVIAVCTYNLWTKHIPGVGALNMGLCRGISLLLGATAVPHGHLSIPLMLHGRLDHLAIGFGTVTLFIAAVTHLARFETRASAPGYAKWLPAAMLIAGFAAFFPLVGGLNRLPTLALFVLTVVISTQSAWQLTVDPLQPLPPVIGRFIRLLLPLQAAYCSAAGDMAASAFSGTLILLWPISRIVGRRFYAS